MGVDLGLGYLDITFFTFLRWDIGLAVPWWAIALVALTLVFSVAVILSRLIRATGRG
ncbi:hypothetical protein ACIBKY_03245 [Nonomuraea sp. NPDC050394]|uniref:hypothetical protein n=1 Tax=Nonomuraea sp. NPDC050394 TaxID=3364363 RepID=UPI003796FF76